LYPDFLFYLFDKPIQNQSEESIVFTFYERKKIIDFLDELGLFIEEKPICTKKKIRHYAVCRLPSFNGCPNENFVRPIFERCFQVRDFSFGITEGIGLTGVIFHF
jgi:hypothetical protein